MKHRDLYSGQVGVNTSSFSFSECVYDQACVSGTWGHVKKWQILLEILTLRFVIVKTTMWKTAGQSVN